MRLGKAVRTAVGAARQPARQRGGGFFLAAAKRGRLRVFFPVGLPDLLYLYAHARDNLIIKEKAAETAAAKERGGKVGGGQSGQDKKIGRQGRPPTCGKGRQAAEGEPAEKAGKRRTAADTASGKNARFSQKIGRLFRRKKAK